MSEHNFFHFMLPFKKLKKAHEIKSIFLRIKSLFPNFPSEQAYHLADNFPKYFQEVSPFQDPLISFLDPFYPIQLCSNDKLFQPRIHRPKHWSRSWFDPFEQKFRKIYIIPFCILFFLDDELTTSSQLQTIEKYRSLVNPKL